jgi:hypothetical protein
MHNHSQGTAEPASTHEFSGVIALFTQIARSSSVIPIGRLAGSLANIGIAGQRFPGLCIERCRLIYYYSRILVLTSV